MKKENLYQKIRILVFKEDGLFYASALELNITESGDDKFIAMYNLEEAIKGYLEFAEKEGILENVFNQEKDDELEYKWNQVFSNDKQTTNNSNLLIASWFNAYAFN
jgi:predicted RNase H-like HicB family nuclease